MNIIAVAELIARASKQRSIASVAPLSPPQSSALTTRSRPRSESIAAVEPPEEAGGVWSCRALTALRESAPIAETLAVGGTWADVQTHLTVEGEGIARVSGMRAGEGMEAAA
jgi:hypothetical protein